MNRFSGRNPDGTHERVKIEVMPTVSIGTAPLLDPIEYLQCTRRAPRNYAHRLARLFIDLTKAAIAAGIFASAVTGILMFAETYLQLPWKAGLIAITAIVVLIVWNDA